MKARLLSSMLLLTLACGPEKLGGDTSGDPSTSTSAGTESSDTESSDTDEPATTTAGILPEPDLGQIACDPFMQDCPEGEKCVAYASSASSWDDFKCVPIMGDQAPGEPCIYGGVVEATDDCDGTSSCWDVQDVDGELIGRCHEFCTGGPDWPECPEDSYCLIASTGVPSLCIPTCDPIEQDCSIGEACYWSGNAFECIFTGRNVPAGQACDFINDCAAGLGCFAAEVLPDCGGSACCSAFCDLELGDGQCEAVLAGTVCSAFFEEGMAPPDYEHVGVCILPP